MRYVLLNFKFDMDKFAATLRTCVQGDNDVFSEAIGVDRSTLANWMAHRYRGKFAHPSMSNFIAACNWLDLDPRDFFVLDE